MNEHYQIVAPSGARYSAIINVEKAKSAKHFTECVAIKGSPSQPTHADIRFLNDWLLTLASEAAKHAGRTMMCRIRAKEFQLWACNPDGTRELQKEGDLKLNQPVNTKPVFNQEMTIKGDSKDLDAIASSLSFGKSGFEIIKYSDPADIKFTAEQQSQLLRGNIFRAGTTSLVVRFNGDGQSLKLFILERFPNVVFP